MLSDVIASCLDPAMRPQAAQQASGFVPVMGCGRDDLGAGGRPRDKPSAGLGCLGFSPALVTHARSRARAAAARVHRGGLQVIASRDVAVDRKMRGAKSGRAIKTKSTTSGHNSHIRGL
jgi:hypothetical protein